VIGHESPELSVILATRNAVTVAAVCLPGLVAQPKEG
jgi:hypothetical protein